MKRRLLFAAPLVVITTNAGAEPCKPPSTCNPPRPIVGRILKADVSGDALIATVDRGTNHGIRLEWRACILDGDSARCRDDERAVVIRVDAKQSMIKVRLTRDQLSRHSRVRFIPDD